jgi:hypothetical protein
MNMSNPRGVHARAHPGKSAKRGGATNRASAPVRMTNQMTVMGRGRKRGGKSR